MDDTDGPQDTMCLEGGGDSMPTVCIGIPTLNRPHFVARTVTEALAQSTKPDEVIVYDQGDSDVAGPGRAPEADGAERVRWIQGGRPSLTAARNQILAHTSCELVIFIDDDVLLPTDFIERCLERFMQDDVTCLQCEVFQRKENVEIDELTCENRWATCFPQFAPERPNGEHSLLYGCHAVRREVAVGVGGYDEYFVGSAFGEDVEFGYRVLAAGHRLHLDPAWWLVHVRAPRGGCRIDEWPQWMESANIWLSITRYGIRERRFGVLFWASLRHGPLLRRNVVYPWRQPMAWVSYVFGMAVGIGRGMRRASSPLVRSMTEPSQSPTD